MVFLFGLWILGIILHVGESINCPPYYNVSHGDSCYFFSTRGETWMDSLIACQTFHGHLVEIETQEEFNFLKRQDLAHIRMNNFYWIGLSDRVIENTWIWATSHEVYDAREFNMWASGEPNRLNQNTEKCVGMDNFAHSNHHYELADLNCEEERNYICESIPFPSPVVGK